MTTTLRQRAIDRFPSKVQPASDCLIWVAGVDRYGYGQHWDGARNRLAHQFAYELAHGPVPEGLVLDHLCRVRNCVNPDHLEPVTVAENNRRAPRPGPRLAVGSRCKAGHLLTEQDLYTHPTRGTTACRACWREQDRQRRQRAASP